MDARAVGRGVRLLAPAAVLAGLGAVSTVLVMVARQTGEPFWGTSLVGLLGALVVAAVLWREHDRLAPGWQRWRRSIAGLTVLVLAYPGLWAAASIADTELTGTRFAWALAVLAGVAYLPVIASFTLFPLLAIGYLGSGSTRVPATITVTLFVTAAVTYVLFFGEFEPLASTALIRSDAGAAVGFGINTLATASVLLGPVWALVAAWRSRDEAARRLALVGASSLSGIALVMLCTVVGSATDVGGVAVVCGMYLALGVVVTGCSYALTTPELPQESTRATTTSLQAPDDGWSSDRAVGSPTASPDSREVGTRVVPDVGAMPEGNEKSAVADLTGREAQVLALLAEGFSNAGIAANLCISERTVDAHLRSVFTKLDLPDTRLDNRRVHAARVWRVSEGVTTEQK